MKRETLTLQERLAVVTKQIKSINQWFFPIEEDEKISFHDAFWFYGILGGAVILTAVVTLIAFV